MVCHEDNACIVIHTHFPQRIEPVSDEHDRTHICIIVRHLICGRLCQFRRGCIKPVRMLPIILRIIDIVGRHIVRFAEQRIAVRKHVHHHQESAFSCIRDLCEIAQVGHNMIGVEEQVADAFCLRHVFHNLCAGQHDRLVIHADIVHGAIDHLRQGFADRIAEEIAHADDFFIFR